MSGSFIEFEAFEGNEYMSNNNVTKFQHIVAGLSPEKKAALYQKMKSLPDSGRNEMIDKVVAAYETRKLTIEQPVAAGRNTPPANYTITPSRGNQQFAGRNIMTVGNRNKKTMTVGNTRSMTVNANRNMKPSVQRMGNTGAAVVAARRPGVNPPITKRHVAAAGSVRANVSVPTVISPEARRAALRAEAERKQKQAETIRKALKIGLMVAGRASIVLVFSLVLVLCGFYTFLGIIMKGPSPHLRDQFVSSVMESSVGGVMAQLVLSDDEIQEILNRNKTQEFDTITNTALVKIASKSESANANAVNPYDPDGDGVEIHEISGPMYRGVMMVVQDPSRVKVSTLEQFNHTGAGLTLKEHIDKSGAIGGINGGKYEDKGGMGIGGWPEGIVIADGQMRMGYAGGTYDVYGFTKDNVLVVGRMTGKQAMDIGVRDAVSFGPTLIVNGVAAKYSGNSGGLNPRTAIGQREDGAVLLLVIEGRKTASMGATMADLIEVMKEYGAVNAANLDGGMSSAMWYNNEELVSSSSIRQSRKMPTAFVVLPKSASNNAQAPAKEA